MKTIIRSTYSNPAAVVAIILAYDLWRDMWEQELINMRECIQRMRQLFVNTLLDKGAWQDFSFITRQNGMFSFSVLTEEKVLKLRA